MIHSPTKQTLHTVHVINTIMPWTFQILMRIGKTERILLRSVTIYLCIRRKSFVSLVTWNLYLFYFIYFAWSDHRLNSPLQSAVSPFICSLMWSDIIFPLFLEKLKSKLNFNMSCGFDLSPKVWFSSLTLLYCKISCLFHSSYQNTRFYHAEFWSHWDKFIPVATPLS